MFPAFLHPADASAEHLHRAGFFLRTAETIDPPQVFSALIAAAVYASRAAAEVFFHAAKLGITEWTPDEFKECMETEVRHFKTIEYLRLHDFHRGLIIYSPGASYGIGPFELKPGPQRNTSVEAIFGPNGVELNAKNGAKAKADRPVTVYERNVLSSSSGELVPVVTAIQNYIEDMRRLLPDLESKVRFQRVPSVAP